ncbi:MAG: hypothetical protein AAF160_06665 [Pseudomonadota bacterium]
MTTVGRNVAWLAMLGVLMPIAGAEARASKDLIAVQALKDKCYNKGPNGTRTEVKCPDVIVAKPNSSASQPGTRPGNQPVARPGNRLSQVAVQSRLSTRVATARRTPPRGATLTGRVPISKGTYNCYNENPPNSGHFDRVTCPDEIVLDTND